MLGTGRSWAHQGRMWRCSVCRFGSRDAAQPPQGLCKGPSQHDMPKVVVTTLPWVISRTDQSLSLIHI
eukprot:2843285-Pyramimonas_sp.AAC.1